MDRESVKFAAGLCRQGIVSPDHNSRELPLLSISSVTVPSHKYHFTLLHVLRSSNLYNTSINEKRNDAQNCSTLFNSKPERGLTLKLF